MTTEGKSAGHLVHRAVARMIALRSRVSNDLGGGDLGTSYTTAIDDIITMLEPVAVRPPMARWQVGPGFDSAELGDPMAALGAAQAQVEGGRFAGPGGLVEPPDMGE